jgi:hypothetical protein
MLVSGNYFDVLGIGMAAGSPIQAEDNWVPVSGGARGLVAVLSHQYWQRRFNGSAATVGTSMQINGHPLSNPRNNWLRIIARVKPATSLAQAQAEMTVVFRLASEFAHDVPTGER